MATIKLDPITRLEGHMKVEVEIDDNNKVTEARSTGNMFRGFEAMLKNRDPRDAVHITQRICGLCPVSHGIAAVKAIEASKGFTPSDQAVLIRNLIEGGNFLSDHILHFYHLSLLDYVKGPDKSPWKTNFNTDMRFSEEESKKIFEHYVKALDVRRKGHQMVALLGGRMPHVRSIMPGGVTKVPSADEIKQYKELLSEVSDFINNEYYEDVQKVASVYSDYFDIGKGYGNLISFGAFEVEEANGSKQELFRSGRYTNGDLLSVDFTKIKESTKYSWYKGSSAQGITSESSTPDINKSGAYSWIKSTRYEDTPYEAGPIARMWINGDYRNGVSVMDRHVAKMLEAKKLANALSIWINNLKDYKIADTTSGDKYNKDLYDPKMHSFSYLTNGEGVGVTEAPRGALLHYIKYSVSDTPIVTTSRDGTVTTAYHSLIDNYQVITPTCWNASPKDTKGKRGPLEQALIGVTISDVNNPVELMRIVHSFDPCTACAVHIMTPDKSVDKSFIVSTPNPNGII